ncbi:MAG: hypothetical protein QNL04_10850 [SAR324 cluster bacterium]|nr:hypothetical protein [SAR324 cluster bacterium]
MIQFINQFKVALSANATDTDTTLSLTDASELNFDKIGDYYLLTLVQSGSNNYEIVRVTAKSANDITVIRGQESTTALTFSNGDSVENRLTAGSCTTFVEPVGTVKAWVPASFADANNGGYALGLGIATNDVAGANAYLAATAYRVADGSIPNLELSPIWNDGVKHLPNLTDDRFIQGSSTLAGVGGSNSLRDHLHSFSLLAAGQGGGSHSHFTVRNIAAQGGISNTSSIAKSWSTYSLGGHTYSPNWGLTNSVSHAHSSSNVSGTVGAGATATTTENRPNYLNCFYIIKVL